MFSAAFPEDPFLFPNTGCPLNLISVFILPLFNFINTDVSMGTCFNVDSVVEGCTSGGGGSRVEYTGFSG